MTQQNLRQYKRLSAAMSGNRRTEELETKQKYLKSIRNCEDGFFIATAMESTIIFTLACA